MNQFPAAPPASQDFRISLAIFLFMLGWMTQEYALFDISRYSVVLLYLAAIPFCLRMTSRSFVFVLLPFISTIYAAVLALLRGGIRPISVLSQGTLQMLAIFFAAGVAAIDWRKYILPLTKILAGLSVPVVLYGGYQMAARIAHLKYAFLPVTNQQVYATGGLQRGWEKSYFTRASSVFAEPSEFGYLSVWLMVLGLSADKGRWRVLCLTLAICGMLFSQSLSAALSVGIILIAYLVANGINWNVARQSVIVLLFSVMLVFAIRPLAPEAFKAFSDRISQALNLDKEADSGRVDHLPANWNSFMEEPVWGHGLASISASDPSGDDVTTFTYFLILIERGLVGSVFFFAPWLWLTWRAARLPKTDGFRALCLMLCVLNLYTFWVSSIAYSLQYWLSLGICASCILQSYLPRTQLAISGYPALLRNE